MKQVILVRSDLELSRGKLAAQAAHASIGAYRNSDRKIAKKWEASGEKKVVLRVSDMDELMVFFEKAKGMKLPCYLVKDAGRTELPPGTATALGIGPAEEKNIDALTGGLKLA